MTEKTSILKKFRIALTHPYSLFLIIEDEPRIKPAFVYLSCLAIFALVTVYLRGLDQVFHNALSQGDLFEYSILAEPLHVSVPTAIGLFFLFLMVLLLAYSVLFLPLIHFTVKTFKGKNSKDKTYQIFAYGMTLSLFFIAIPIASFFGIIWSFIFHIIGLKKVHEMKTWQAIGATAVSWLVFGLLVFISLVVFISFFPS